MPIINKYFIISVILFIATFKLLNGQVNPSYRDIPLRIYPNIGFGIPQGGSREDFIDKTIHFGFNVKNTHNPTLLLGIGAETPWFDNWFQFDSLWVGAKISTQKFSSKKIQYNENLRLSTFYLTISRSFWFSSVNPYLRVGLGASTLHTSPYSNFVFSGGALLNLGFRENIGGHDFGLEVGYNAPLIAYKNILTGFIEINFLYVFTKGIQFKKKEELKPSFEN